VGRGAFNLMRRGGGGDGRRTKEGRSVRGGGSPEERGEDSLLHLKEGRQLQGQPVVKGGKKSNPRGREKFLMSDPPWKKNVSYLSERGIRRGKGKTLKLKGSFLRGKKRRRFPFNAACRERKKSSVRRGKGG